MENQVLSWALVQLGLQIVGVAAIGLWLVRWVSAFSEKQRELSDVDKAARGALHEALSAEQALRTAIKEQHGLQVSMLSTELETLRKALETKIAEVGELEKLRRVVRAAQKIGHDAARQLAQKQLNKASVTCARFFDEWRQGKGKAPEVFGRVFSAALGEQERPTDPEERLLFEAFSLFGVVFGLQEQMVMLSTIGQSVVEEYEKDPSAPAVELVKRWGNRVMDGKLYKSARPTEGIFGFLPSESKE